MMTELAGELRDTRGLLHFTLGGAGPCIVLCHALGTDSSIWSSFAHELRRDFRVVTYDLRGHGASHAAADRDYSFESMAEDVRRLLDYIGAARAVVVGISIGGEVAQMFAAQYPTMTHGLVLCSTACVTEPERARIWEKRIQQVEDSGMREVADASVQRWFTADFRARNPSTVEKFRQRLAQLDPAVYISMARTIQAMDLRPGLRHVTAPTLVLVGAQDSNTGPPAARTILQNLQDAALYIVNDAAHFPNIEAPQRFNTMVLDWLRMVDTRARIG